jgi:hypothetical protein
MIFRCPFSLKNPASPVCTQPSSVLVCTVAYGFF